MKDSPPSPTLPPAPAKTTSPVASAQESIHQEDSTPLSCSPLGLTVVFVRNLRFWRQRYLQAAEETLLVWLTQQIFAPHLVQSIIDFPLLSICISKKDAALIPSLARPIQSAVKLAIAQDRLHILPRLRIRNRLHKLRQVLVIAA